MLIKMKNKNFFYGGLITALLLCTNFFAGQFLISVSSNTIDNSTPQLTTDSDITKPIFEITSMDQEPITSFEPKAPRTGAQDFAVICAHFSDEPTTRWTRAEIETIMGTIDDFWQNASDGSISINYQVEGWYDIGKNAAAYPNLADHWQDFIRDAIDAADSDINFNNYDFVLVWINRWWRGWSTIGSWFNINTDEGSFSVGASLVGERDAEAEAAVWGRVAHEMGHAFGLGHTHGSGTATTKNYESWYSLMARAYPSHLNVYSRIIDGATGWFATGSNQKVIDVGDSDTVVVRPRHLDITGDYQAIKVRISGTKYYMVEVIDREEEDAWLPDEGVYIYIVDKSEPDDDECTDQDGTPGTGTVSDCLWDVGDTFTDTTNSITIEVKSQIGNGYEISVTNAGAGAPDLKIAEWGDPEGSPPPYESVDIWVDSQVNGWGHYRHRYGTIPVGIGDEPWANHVNRLYGRIHNIGQTDATGVQVKYYENLPIGAGDNGAWNLIGTKTVDVDAGDYVEEYIEWTPSITLSPGDSGLMAIHSCVKIEIVPATGETSTGNNEAQENIDNFEIVSTGSRNPGVNANGYTTITTTMQFANPFRTEEDIYVNILDVTEGWNVTGAYFGKFTTLPSLGSKEFDVTVIPNPKAPITERITVQMLAGYVSYAEDPQGNFVGDMHLEPFGGVTFTATIMYRSEIEIEAEIINEEIHIMGHISFLDDMGGEFYPSEEADSNVLLEIAFDDIQEPMTEYVNVFFDEKGDFEHYHVPTRPGNYTIRAYYAGTEFIASSSSDTLIADTIAKTVITSSTPPFPGFELFLTLGSIILVVFFVRTWKRKQI
ncbi:MAG: hypothetical protein GF308_10960 [Candidatus Heimdallarchaeota archaeon]|nr:hypothetical protein [Candidatus Heimdallarchaeota archaeon]